MAEPFNPASSADDLADQFPNAMRAIGGWLNRNVNKPLATIIPGTASNKQFTDERVAPALSWLEDLLTDPDVVVGPTTAPGVYSTESPPGSPRAADAGDAPKATPAAAATSETTTQRAKQLSREERLAAIVAAATTPQRTDRDADKLSGSLLRPLVYTEQDGQKIPFSTVEAHPGWRSGADARTFVGYSEDDVLEPSTWGSPEKVGRLQHRLVNAGLLTGDFKFGYYDATTSAAYKELLTFATTQGITSTKALVEMHARRREAAEQGVPWEYGEGELAESEYAAPDPASVRQMVRQMYRETLDRDPDADELARYADEFHAASEEQWQAVNGVQDPDQMAESVFDEAPELAADAQGQTTQVDPVARFQEKFDQRTSGERKFLDDQSANASQGGLLGSILGSIDEAA